MGKAENFEGYSLDFIASISPKPISKNGPISDKNYLELAIEASNEYNKEFPDEVFDE